MYELILLPEFLLQDIHNLLTRLSIFCKQTPMPWAHDHLQGNIHVWAYIYIFHSLEDKNL